MKVKLKGDNKGSPFEPDDRTKDRTKEMIKKKKKKAKGDKRG